jgi:hypothetical protein
MAKFLEVSLDKIVIERLEAEQIRNTNSSDKQESFLKTVSKMIPSEKSFGDILGYEGITETELVECLNKV